MAAHVTESGERLPLVAEPVKTAAVVAAGFACLSGVLLGYDIGVTNGALLPVAKYFDMTSAQMELFVGSLSLMALPGCVFGGYAADFFGRLGSIAIGAVLFLVGNSLMALATSYIMLLLGRAIAGIAVGMTIVTEPLYTAETSPARLRGMLSTNVEVSFNVGIVLGFTSSWCLRDLPDSTSWRWMMGLCLFAPIISLIGVFFILPESPRWLAKRGRLDDAEQVLHKLLGPVEADKSFQLMKEEAKIGSEPEMTWLEVAASAKIRWLFFLGAGIAFFQQATGIESIMYYSSVILQEGGLSRNLMLLSTMIMGFFKLAAIIAQGFVVDITGRKPMLVLSSLGMSVSMMILGLSFQFSWGWQMKVVPIVLFVVLFSLGYGPITYTLNAELYPTSCRSKGVTFAMGVGRLFSAIVSLTFLSLARLLTFAGAFMFFAMWGIVSVAFVKFLVPETTGKSLEEADCHKA